MTAYYNECDKKAAAWLRELIADGHIAPGDVDERSILDVTPDDLRGYTQCHWFAGIGGWSAALRLAGWPDSQPVWTGSCPCQPFSEAGGRAGLADERHLWPYWHHLIAQCRPRVVFGEQVEAAIRYGWLDLVRDDLEALDYAFGAAGLPAACVGAPHIRQRLWFVADTDGGHAGTERQQRSGQLGLLAQSGGGRTVGILARRCGPGFGGLAQSGLQRSDLHDPDGRSELGVALGDAERTRLPQRLGLPGVPGWALGTGARQAAVGAGFHVGAIGMADAQRDDGGRKIDTADHFGPEGDRPADWPSGRRGALGADSVADSTRIGSSPGARIESVRDGTLEPQRSGDIGFWDSAIWIDCRDGKRRPVEPGIFPLASGVSGRVGLLRGSGNAIVPQVAAAFIEEYLATRSVI